MINAKLDLDVNKIIASRGLEEGGKVQKYIDSECIRLMSPYTPKKDGDLIDSADKLTTIGSGEIRQGGALAPYAVKWYYTNANFNGAPIRGTHWFERMKNDGGKESILNGAKKIAGAK